MTDAKADRILIVDDEINTLEGLRWGLCHAFGKDRWGYIRRYEVDERRKNDYLNRRAYE